MSAFDATAFLDDFETEAKAHIETIETAFLDPVALVGNGKLIDTVFRAAHSLKGTAGLFSLDKIVAVAHELESLFSRLREGAIIPDDNISDIALKSVDCLRRMTDNIRGQDSTDVSQIVSQLRAYSSPSKQGLGTGESDANTNAGDSDDNSEGSPAGGAASEGSPTEGSPSEDSLSDSAPAEGAASDGAVSGDSNRAPRATPFNPDDIHALRALENAAKRGQWAYYVDISYDRGLTKYYGHPRLLTDEILSVGSIVGAFVNDAPLSANSSEELAERVAVALEKPDTSTLDLIVTSILEPELFLIALELDEKNVRFIPKPGASNSARRTSPATPRIESPPATPPAIQSAAPPPEPPSTTTLPPAMSPPPAPLPPAPPPVTTPLATRTPVTTKSDASIRLEVSVVNNLMDLANEMILTRNRLLASVSASARSIAGLTPILHDMSRLSGEIQEKVMRTRMQPVSSIFGKFPRIIRDTARALGKDIGIEIIGEDTSLDKYLLESLSDPITQLVKNAADHGVERSQRRSELGKPQKGLITLKAYMRDGSAIMEVSDDGAGIDADALRRIARERKIAAQEQLVAMSDTALFSLIFEPGFSTAKRVTNVSGRGVGMDIVKTNIEKLGGVIEVESEENKGTTIRLRLPLTLSVARTLIVTIDSVRFAAPEVNVERIARISAKTPTKYIDRIGNALILNLDGWLLPLVTIDDLDAIANRRALPKGAATFDRLAALPVKKCLVLKSGDLCFALLIDDAVETEEALVKPLPIYLRQCRCYSNVTVLGNGDTVMILDPEGIIRLTGIGGVPKPTDCAVSLANDDSRASTPDQRKRDILIFKSVGPELFAADMDNISRVERVAADRIQEFGEGLYINTAGGTVRIARPEDYAPVKKREYDSEKTVYLLTIKNASPPVGIVATKVLTKTEWSFPLAESFIKNRFVSGSGAYGDRVLLFLDADAIAQDALSKDIPDGADGAGDRCGDGEDRCGDGGSGADGAGDDDMAGSIASSGVADGSDAAEIAGGSGVADTAGSIAGFGVADGSDAADTADGSDAAEIAGGSGVADTAGSIASSGVEDGSDAADAAGAADNADDESATGAKSAADAADTPSPSAKGEPHV